MLTHIGTNKIETERLILRPFRLEDCPKMFENWASDDDVTRFLTWTSHRSITDTENVVNLWTSEYNRNDTYHWVIILKRTNEPIGSIAVVNYNASSEYAEMGYCMGKYWWGMGIMTEALDAVLDYLFTRVGFNSIRASHAVKNPASGRVMEKCGMKYDGTFRQYFKSTCGEFLDISFRSILKSEYISIEKRHQECYNSIQ